MKLYIDLGLKELFFEVQLRGLSLTDYVFYSKRSGDYDAYVPLILNNSKNLGLCFWVRFV